MTRPLPALLAALALASLAGCLAPTEEEPAFTFGLADVKSAATGSFRGTLARADGTKTDLAIELAHAPPAYGAQCGNRALGYEVACVDESSMGLTGTVTTGDGERKADPVTGAFRVIGLNLTNGELDLEASDHATFRASWSAGAFADGRAADPRGAPLGTFTLERR